MEVTLDLLKKHLKYDRITEDVEDCAFGFLWIKERWKRHRFYVWPDDDTLPYIELGFDAGEDEWSVLYVGLSEYQDHFDDYPDEKRNVAEAIAFTRRLIAGDIYVMEELGAEGHYLGGTNVTPDQDYTAGGRVSCTLTSNTSRIRRVVFNKPIEEIEVPSKTDAGSAADAAPDP